LLASAAENLRAGFQLVGLDVAFELIGLMAESKR
jgi:hypothetical protein